MNTSTRHRQCGSVLLLVLVVILILVLLGMAYLAMARMDRRATADMSNNNIDTVVASVIGKIQSTLADDIFSTNGSSVERFRGLTLAASGQETGFDEPHDYPWTNTTTRTVTLLYGTSASPAVAAGSQTAQGGQNDDPWLAAAHPEDVSGNQTWRQITDLMGIYVRLPTGTNKRPDDLPLDNTSTNHQWRRNQDVRISGPSSTPPGLDNSTSNFDLLGIDTDGDGIADSKWTWAPINRIGDVAYVMAVRIVDASARINPSVSVYTGGTSAGDRARWWTPGDLNIARALGLASTDTTLGAWITYMFTTPDTGTSDIYPVMPTLHDSRLLFWTDTGGGFYGMPEPNEYTVQPGQNALNQLEIMHRHGLNNNDYTSKLEESMPTLLRAGSAGETAYNSNPPNYASVAAYFANNPRLRLTHYSGAGQIDPVPNSTIGSALVNSGRMMSFQEVVAYPLNTVACDALRDMLIEPDMPFGSWTTAAVRGFPITPVYGAAAPATNAQGTTIATTAASQLIANFVDYFDTDGRLTCYNDRYGMEALPFLTEVYLQGQYVLTAAVPSGTPGNYNLTWTIQGDIGYMIELANPWYSSVRDLDNVRLVVKTNPVSAPTTVTTTDFGTLKSLMAGNPTTMTQRSATALWRKSGPAGNLTDPPAMDSFTGWTAITPTEMTHATNQKIPVPGANQSTEVVVELHAKALMTTARVDTSNGTITSTQFSGDSNLSATNNTYTGMTIRFTSGALNGQTRNITAYTGSSRRFTVSPAFSPTPSNTDSFEIEQWVPYSRIRRRPGDAGVAVTEEMKLPERVLKTDVGPYSAAPAVNTPASTRFVQLAAYADYAGLNIIAARSTAAVNEFRGAASAYTTGNNTWDADWPSVDPNGDTNPVDMAQAPLNPSIDAVGKQTKGGAPVWIAPFSSDTPRYEFDDLGARYVTDILRVMFVGPYKHPTDANQDRTYAEVFQTAVPQVAVADPLKARMLHYSDTTTMPVPGTGTPANRKVPRVQLLLDRLLAVPLQNGNVPISGRINFNTIPRQLLEDALPISDATLRANVATAINNLRTRSFAGTRDASLKGIASIGELLQLSAVTSGGGSVDIFDGAGFPASGTSGDRAEEVRLAGYLTNVGGVRSDYFLAYVIVRGYITSDFSIGPVESAQFVALLDRSAVRFPVDAPRVVAFKRIK